MAKSMTTLHLGIDTDDDGFLALQLVPNPTKPRGGVVVLDEWLLDQLHLAFDEIESGPTPRGFLLESASERVFVAGADLAEIDACDDEALHRYLEKGARAYMRITSLACPSVALIGGAALGGGLEIAMHCDGLVGVRTAEDEKPYLIGLPEAGLGLCPGWGGTQMLPARMNAADAISATANGKPFKSNSIPAGLFDEQVACRETLAEAGRFWLNSNPRKRQWETPRCIADLSADELAIALETAGQSIAETDAARAVVECVKSGINHGFQTALETERRNLVALRHTPAAREKLESFLNNAR